MLSQLEAGRGCAAGHPPAPIPTGPAEAPGWPTAAWGIALVAPSVASAERVPACSSLSLGSCSLSFLCPSPQPTAHLLLGQSGRWAAPVHSGWVPPRDVRAAGSAGLGAGRRAWRAPCSTPTAAALRGSAAPGASLPQPRSDDRTWPGRPRGCPAPGLTAGPVARRCLRSSACCAARCRTAGTGTCCRPRSTACASWRPSTARPWCPVCWAAPCPSTGTGYPPAWEGGRAPGLGAPSPHLPLLCPSAWGASEARPWGGGGRPLALGLLSRAVPSTPPGLSPAGQRHHLWADTGARSSPCPRTGPAPTSHPQPPSSCRCPVLPVCGLPSAAARSPGGRRRGHTCWCCRSLPSPPWLGPTRLGCPVLLHKLPGRHLAFCIEAHLG